MTLLSTLADVRDVVVIVTGIIEILFFIAATVMTVILGLLIRSLLKTVRGLLDETVRPAVDSVRDAAQTVRGTTEFVGETAASPIVRAYGTFAGVRKGLGVLSGLGRRGRG